MAKEYSFMLCSSIETPGTFTTKAIVLLPQFDAKEYIRAIGDYNVTWLTSVAAMMAMVVREEKVLQETNLSSVKIVRMGSWTHILLNPCVKTKSKPI